MAGTTSKYKLPFPTATDPVWQGAQAIEALARRVEVVLSAANIPTTPASAAPPADEGGAP